MYSNRGRRSRRSSSAIWGPRSNGTANRLKLIFPGNGHDLQVRYVIRQPTRVEEYWTLIQQTSCSYRIARIGLAKCLVRQTNVFLNRLLSLKPVHCSVAPPRPDTAPQATDLRPVSPNANLESTLQTWVVECNARSAFLEISPFSSMTVSGHLLNSSPNMGSPLFDSCFEASS